MQLLGHKLGSQKLLTDLLKERQKFHYYGLQVFISQGLAIDNIAYYNPFLNPHWNIYSSYNKILEQGMPFNFFFMDNFNNFSTKSILLLM